MKIGSTGTSKGIKAMMLGSGELGKEVVIELQRLGVETVACDKYPNAPAMQVAHNARVFNMLDATALRKAVEEEKPDFIIPEVEAIATPELVKLEQEGWHVVPTARAALLTMNREGIRRLAAEDLGLTTSPYKFASTREEFDRGDYRWSWQPQPMSDNAIEKAKAIAKAITDALGGYGIFGVELFVKGDDVIFSEVSPRPHDTGMVTMISQDMSEFALHARALLGLPVPGIKFYGPSASRAVVVEGDTDTIEFDGLEEALKEPGVQIRIFGKPEIKGHRRMGVVLATADSLEEARAKVDRAYDALKIHVHEREKR